MSKDELFGGLRAFYRDCGDRHKVGAGVDVEELTLALDRLFNQFLNKHRIQDACKQLVAPKTQHLPILSIALDVGFRSLSSFNKTFKEQMDKTPTEFRKEHPLNVE